MSGAEQSITALFEGIAIGWLKVASQKAVADQLGLASDELHAVDLVRRRENRQLKAAGDDRLAGTRYDWLRHPATIEVEDRRQFAQLRDSNLKTA